METINFIVLFALGVIASGALGYLLSVTRKYNSKLSKIDDLENDFNIYKIYSGRIVEDLERNLHMLIDEQSRERDQINKDISDDIEQTRRELTHEIGELSDKVLGMVGRRFDNSYSKIHKLETEIYQAIDSINQQLPNKKEKLGDLRREY